MSKETGYYGLIECNRTIDEQLKALVESCPLASHGQIAFGDKVISLSPIVGLETHRFIKRLGEFGELGILIIQSATLYGGTMTFLEFVMADACGGNIVKSTHSFTDTDDNIFAPNILLGDYGDLSAATKDAVYWFLVDLVKGDKAKAPRKKYAPPFVCKRYDIPRDAEVERKFNRFFRDLEYVDVLSLKDHILFEADDVRVMHDYDVDLPHRHKRFSFSIKGIVGSGNLGIYIPVTDKPFYFADNLPDIVYYALVNHIMSFPYVDK